MAAPGGGRHGAVHRRHHHGGIAIGNRQHRNFQNDRGFLAGQALGVFGGADARRQRIARINHHVRHRAALDALRRPHRAIGIGGVQGITVIGGIGINQAADGAMILGQLRLEAAPAFAIAGDHDLAFDRDAELLKPLVIIHAAIIHIDQRRGDIAITLIFDIGGKRRVLGGGAGIAGDRRLLQRGGERLGAQHLQFLIQRRGIKHLELFDMGIPARRLELRQDPFAVGFVVRRTHMIGFGRKEFVDVPHIVGMDMAVELRRQAGLIGRLGPGRAQKRRQDKSRSQKECRTTHVIPRLQTGTC